MVSSPLWSPMFNMPGLALAYNPQGQIPQGPQYPQLPYIPQQQPPAYTPQQQYGGGFNFMGYQPQQMNINQYHPPMNTMYQHPTQHVNLNNYHTLNQHQVYPTQFHHNNFLQVNNVPHYPVSHQVNPWQVSGGGFGGYPMQQQQAFNPYGGFGGGFGGGGFGGASFAPGAFWA